MALLIIDNGLIIGSLSTVPPSMKQPANVLDAEYQNGSRWRVVTCTIVSTVWAINDVGKVYPSIKGSAGVTSGTNWIGLIGYGVALQIQAGLEISLTVPPNYYYKMISSVAGTGSVALEAGTWTEIDL